MTGKRNGFQRNMIISMLLQVQGVQAQWCYGKCRNWQKNAL